MCASSTEIEQIRVGLCLNANSNSPCTFANATVGHNCSLQPLVFRWFATAFNPAVARCSALLTDHVTNIKRRR